METSRQIDAIATTAKVNVEQSQVDWLVLGEPQCLGGR
jgi:hypothetical protein